MNDADKIKEQLIDELAKLRHSLAVEQAAEHIREAVLAMRKSEDISEVVAVMWRQLKSMAIETPYLSIHFIDDVGKVSKLPKISRLPKINRLPQRVA